MTKKLNTVFLGTPDFSVPSLELLNNHPSINLTYVISMPDRPAGRGHSLKSPEVIEYAKNNKINYFQTQNINKEEKLIKTLKNESVDLFIVLAFAQFLNNDVLTIPSIGCFNIHTSLLPKYRGAAPIHYAVLNGDKETGVSIQKMVKKMDAGDIVKESPVKISNDETGGQLYTRLKFEAALCLNEFIKDILSNNITSRAQDESKVSFAPTLKREDGKLDFNNNFEKLNNQVRALHPWPGTYCHLNSKRLKVFNISKAPDEVHCKTGEMKIFKGMLCIGCSDAVIRIVDLQLEGKKRCLDIDLTNGLQNKEIIIS